MSEKRLEQLQAVLTERGYKDVKFFFGAISETPVSQLAADVADALDAVVQGQAIAQVGLGDSVRNKAAASN